MSAVKAPRKQTRRSISVSAATYNKLMAYCKKSKISMSGFVEERIAEYFSRGSGKTKVSWKTGTQSGRMQADRPNEANQPKTQEKLSDVEAHRASKIFTF